MKRSTKQKVYHWLCSTKKDIDFFRDYHLKCGLPQHGPSRQRAILYCSWFINSDTDPFQLALELPEMRVYALGREADGYPIIQIYQLSKKEQETLLGRIKDCL